MLKSLFPNVFSNESYSMSEFENYYEIVSSALLVYINVTNPEEEVLNSSIEIVL